MVIRAETSNAWRTVQAQRLQTVKKHRMAPFVFCLALGAIAADQTRQALRFAG